MGVQMDFPSTTQALFALIVMIIVLIFILVYCFWGTFSCSKIEEEAPFSDRGTRSNIRASGRGRSCRTSNPRAIQDRRGALVILPYNNMVYIGDSENRRVYHFPLTNSSEREDKPPSYNELFNMSRSSTTIINIEDSLSHSEENLDLPPTYEEYFRMYRNIESTELEKALAESIEELKSSSREDSIDTHSPMHIITPVMSVGSSSEPVLTNFIEERRSVTTLSVSSTRSKTPNFFKRLLSSRSTLQDVESQSQLSVSPPNASPRLLRALAQVPKIPSSDSISYLAVSMPVASEIIDIPRSVLTGVIDALPNLEDEFNSNLQTNNEETIPSSYTQNTFRSSTPILETHSQVSGSLESFVSVKSSLNDALDENKNSD